MNFSAISKAIDEIWREYLDLWKDICNIESNSYDKKGINKVADYIVNYATENDYCVERISFADAGDCLCIDWVNGPEKPMVALSAHMDTVYANGVFGDPPVKLDDEFIYGHRRKCSFQRQRKRCKCYQ